MKIEKISSFFTGEQQLDAASRSAKEEVRERTSKRC